MANEIRYVPTVIQWMDVHGNVQQRTVNIEEGLRLNINGKDYTAKAYEYKGMKPLLDMRESEAYSILGFSRMYDDKDSSGPEDVYTLDSKDFEKAHQEYGSSITNNLENKVKGYANGYRLKNIESAHFATDKGQPIFSEFRMQTTSNTKVSIFNKE